MNDGTADPVARPDWRIPAVLADGLAEYQLDLRIRGQRWECGYFGDHEDEDDGVIGVGASPGEAIGAAIATMCRARGSFPLT